MPGTEPTPLEPTAFEPTAFEHADDLVAHLRWLGSLPSVEGDFSELDHGLQTAALVEGAGDDELTVAALVHDLAHPWDGAGQPRHARLGADAVRPLLGDRVARLVAGHVSAKRYLVAVDAGYRDLLSPDSVATLAAQGGAMSADEAAAFAADPDVAAMVALRRADDGAKVPGAVVPALDHWVPVIRAVAQRSSSASSPASMTRSQRSRQSAQR